jgi:hypothetical protein
VRERLIRFQRQAGADGHEDGVAGRGGLFS